MKTMLVRPGPHFSVQDVADGWQRALDDLTTLGDFRLDARMDVFDKALRDKFEDSHERGMEALRLAVDSMLAAVYKFQPDLIVVVSGFFLHQSILQLLRARGHKLVLLATESPYEDDNQAALAPFYDLVVLNDPTNIGMYDNAVYMHHAYDPAIHYKRKTILPEWRSDFCFVGTGYPSRIEFFEQVDFEGIDVALGGNWQACDADSPLTKFVCHDRNHCLDNDDAHDLYSATKASANLYRREAQRPELSEGFAMTPREVELAATGCFFLTERRGENQQILPMVPTFTGPDDFGEKLRWWLAHDSVRDTVTRAAQRAVSDWTFTANARRLLGLVES